jgi:nitrogen fixation NifU-like protein
MATEDVSHPTGQPVTFFDQFSRDELEREIALRTARRFSNQVLRAALFPEHLGEMAEPDGYAGLQGDCGDLISFYLRIVAGQVARASFTTDGGDATIASGEMLATLVEGRTLQMAQRVTAEELLQALGGLPPNHVHCAALAVNTLRQVIAAYREDGAQP